jgi:hypothetical protein
VDRVVIPVKTGIQFPNIFLDSRFPAYRQAGAGMTLMDTRFIELLNLGISSFTFHFPQR